MSPTITKMDAALSCAHRGLAVFPLWHAIPSHDGSAYICACGSAHAPDGKGAAKHPHRLVKNGGHKNATTDPARVSYFWEAAPEANIGINTEGLVVLDVDRPKDGFRSLKALQARLGELPPTWVSLTGGGGAHIIYRAPPKTDIRCNAELLGPGLDIRADGGYIVGPGSVHVSGRKYEWSAKRHPDHVPLADLPDALIQELHKPQTTAARDPDEWVAIFSSPIRDGQRNDTIARVAGYYLRLGMDPLVALASCRNFNLARGAPPLPDDEVERTVESICAREMKRRELR